ncbi:type III-A CRISPR-associated RAMP protein Csm5, partial [Persephonella sp.]
NNKLQIYDFDKVVRALKDNPQRLINLTADIERNPLNKNLGDFLKNYRINVKPAYSVEIKGEIKKRRWDREKNQNILEYKPIWEFIKENGKVYIPGTEIKGAIRTALFYKILKDKLFTDEKLKNKFLQEYQNCLDGKNDNEIKKRFKSLASKWEIIVFRAGFEKAFEKKIDKKCSNATRDVLKILLISDSDLKNPEDVLTVKDVIGINIRRRKFKELHELIKEEISFDTEITVSGFVKKAMIEYGIPEEQASIPKFFITACKEFSKKLIIEEYNYFKNNSFEEPIDKNVVLNQLNKLFQLNKEKGKILIRLGKHQGFLSTTINLLVKELDPELYSRAYKYLVPNGYPEFPNKSRKLTIDNELLGWCVLIPED